MNNFNKRISLSIFFCFIAFGGFEFVKAQDAYIGEIRMFAGNYAPSGWMLCQGQILQINSYTALYSILGTTYGGNGTTNFALPDLRGKVPLGVGNGPGLTPVPIGSTGGTETNTITVNNLPAHSHSLNVNSTTVGRSLQAAPAGNFPAQNQDASGNYAATSDGVASVNAIGQTGSGAPMNNRQPFVGINYIICLEGIYPPRP